MSAFNEFNCFLDDLTSAVHNFNAGGFKLGLTNNEPDPNFLRFNQIFEIMPGNGYVVGGLPIVLSKALVGSTITVFGENTILTAQGGPVGPFQYAVLYNSGSPNGSLIGWWDYGMPLTLNKTEAFTFVPNPTQGLFSIVRAL